METAGKDKRGPGQQNSELIPLNSDDSKAFFESQEPAQCRHSNRPNRIRDIITIILVIFVIFMFREIVCWFFKTNHGQNEIRELRGQVHELRRRVN